MVDLQQLCDDVSEDLATVPPKPGQNQGRVVAANARPVLPVLQHMGRLPLEDDDDDSELFRTVTVTENGAPKVLSMYVIYVDVAD